jgi:hypothetical protein
MSFFWIFATMMVGAIAGYLIGHDCGYEEGRLDGIAEEYMAGQER